jgi:two-component system nitrogen regulation response regulator GlnG
MMARRPQIWVIDDDHAIRWVLSRALSNADLDARTFEDGNRVLEALHHSTPDAIMADIRMPGMDGLTLLKRLQDHSPHLPVIIMTAHSDLDSAVSAYQGGAFEYLPKPFDVDEAVALVKRAQARYAQPAPASPPDTGKADTALPELIGEAPSMQEVFRAIGRLSRSHITVLINGESGTGKELVARALHRHSPRRAGPFIAINTAAIPRDLLESELFGHERGAFTGAQTSRQGRFEQADGGTLFLDEIGDMPAELQTRLLRVLAEGEFYRVGGHTPTRVDVRIIAATHQDLKQSVQAGRFRDDLFHRLNVIRIHLPALRQRREDIPPLLRHFLQSAARELEVEPKQLRPEVEKFLCQLDWPGNVRQLENVCRWLTVMASGQAIHLADLPSELREQTAETADNTPQAWDKALHQWASQHVGDHHPPLLDTALPAFERTLIKVALAHTGGHRQEAARLLGWGRNTLTRKIKELNLE